MNNRPQIIQLINSYREKVAHAHTLLCKYYGTENPLKSWAQSEIPKEGFLNDEKTISFSFHGVGCRVIFPGEEVVDFDYGPGFRYDGFDPGRIYMFVKDKADLYPDLNSLEKIEEEFRKLMEDKVIEYPPHTQLGRQYYFVTSNS